MGWWIILAIFLFVVTAILIIAEVLLPSGGILTICALASLIWAITIFFQQSLLMGWIGIGLGIVIIPTALVGAYRILPHTRFGRMMLLEPEFRSMENSGDAIRDYEELQKLLGSTGKVLSPLRPVGMADFSGRRLECVAESGYIEKDKIVRVIQVRGTQLTVRQEEPEQTS